MTDKTEQELKQEMGYDESSQSRPMCHIMAGEMFQEAAKWICQEVPEIRGLALVFDWKVGQTDFPCGSVYVREEDAASPQSSFALIEQTRKLLWEQIAAAETQISRLEAHCLSLLRKSHEAKKEMEENQAEIQRLKEEAETLQAQVND